MEYLDRAGARYNEMNHLSAQQAAQAEQFLAQASGAASQAAGGLSFCRVASLKRFEADDEHFARSITSFYGVAAKLGATVVMLWQAHEDSLLTCDIGVEASLATELTRTFADQVRGVSYSTSQLAQIDPSYELWGMDGLCCTSAGKNTPRIDEALSSLKPGCSLMLVLNPVSDGEVKDAVTHVDRHASFLSLFHRLSATLGGSRSTSRADGTTTTSATTQVNTSMTTTNTSDTRTQQQGSSRGSNTGVHAFLSTGSNNGSNQSASIARTTGDSRGVTTGTTSGETRASAVTQTTGETDTENLNVTSTFSRITALLQQLTRRRGRLHRARTTGMTRCAVYAFAPGCKARVILAMVNAQSRSEGLQGEASDDVFSSIRHAGSSDALVQLLQTGLHPEGFGTAALPGEIIPFLPMRELRGFQLDYAASYARNIVVREGADTVRIGVIVDEEKVTGRAAALDIDAFTSHILAVGSTGCGKTTALTNLCNQTMTRRPHVHVLAIDPKNAIRPSDYTGGATLYTTRTDTNDNILRLQPFAVPGGVSISAHIDQLQAIFQSCWSMSAAMPDIIKQAIFEVYRACGWDVAHSIHIPLPGKPKWPTFAMLEEETRRIIEEGGFSDRTRSDYIGALCTRLHSLSTNACAEIFRPDNAIPFAELFDQNAIVHCGSISGETLSLIMSVLLMQLVEYRQSVAAGRRNRPLQHITIFEEAHALAPRSSPASDSTENVSIGSKSGEAIIKLLAEARDVGESCVLSNQTVHEISQQAIENTATKLVFHTQGKSDIQDLAAALSLDSTPVNGVSQALGLARLEPYQALAYQRGWRSTPVKIRLDNNPLASNDAARSAVGTDARRLWIGQVLKVLSSAETLESNRRMMQPLLEDARIAAQLRRDTAARLEVCFRAGADERAAAADRLVLSFFDGLVGVLLPHYRKDPTALYKAVVENLHLYADVTGLPPQVQQQFAMSILRAEKERGTPGL